MTVQRTAAQAMKRGADVTAAALLLVGLSPVLGACALAIRLCDGSPVIFVQQRTGRGERTFDLYKFRTMRSPAPGENPWTSDSQRINRIGKLLRRASLDELPQLVNILRGDMSLVGPRPLPIEFLPLYPQRYRVRHTVRPGVTGLAQVAGRRRLMLSQRLDLDRIYVQRWSLWLDLTILARSLAAVVRPGPVDTQVQSVMDDLGFSQAII